MEQIVLNFSINNSTPVLEATGNISKYIKYFRLLGKSLNIESEKIIIKFITHEELAKLISFLPENSFLLNDEGLQFLFGDNIQDLNPSKYMTLPKSLDPVFMRIFRDKRAVFSGKEENFIFIIAKMIDSLRLSVCFIGTESEYSNLLLIIKKFSAHPFKTLERITFINIEKRISKIEKTDIVVISNALLTCLKKSVLQKIFKIKPQYCYSFLKVGKIEDLPNRAIMYKAMGATPRSSAPSFVIERFDKDLLIKV